MPDTIRDGGGHGYLARVNKDLKLHTYAVAAPHQHVVSEEKQDAYQVIGEANLSTGAVTDTILQITNTSSTKRAVITYIRHQLTAAVGLTIPASDAYFQVNLGTAYSSGGTAVTPVNVYSGSGNTAEVTAYEGKPTVTGGSEIDRWYTKEVGDMHVFVKEGALIVPPNKGISLAYVHPAITSGHVYTRVSFMMEDHD